MDMYGNSDTPELTNQQKAAVLFIALGPEYSAMLFKHMNDDEIEKLTLEIANQKKVSQEQKREVIAEFYQMAMAKNYLSTGGLEYAQNILEKALGAEKASNIISRLTTSLQVRPFDFLHKTDPGQLLNFIQNEHPQTIALIMAYLDPDQAATILTSLPQDRQAEVSKRIAVMDRTSPEVLREVDNKDLALALKATNPDVANKVYKNMSKRAGDTMREEIEYMGPVKIRDVEEAQQRIVNIVRKLEDAGDITISRGKGDEMIV